MITAAVVTHPGKIRDRNEDTVAVPGFASVATVDTPITIRFQDRDGPLIFAVIDGMGGHRGGPEASRLVAHQLLADPAGDVGEALNRVNAVLYDAMQRSADLVGMGATVAGVAINRAETTIFNIGDARVYHYSGGYLMLVTVDDRSDPASHAVTQSLGGSTRPTAIAPHLSQVGLSQGDRLLLCSDGLTEVVGFDSIQDAVGTLEPTEAAGALLDATLAAGAPDNVSIVVLEYVNRG
jgi:serine/threonine protein phosphatase PrpC